MSETSRRLCFACRNAVDSDEQFVLARGRQRLAHCSEACVRETLGSGAAPATRSRLHVIASATVAALVLVGGWTVWRHRAPQPRSIALSWVDVTWDKVARAEPSYYGPAWPPTDATWSFAFDRRVGVSAAGPGAPRAGRRRSPFATDPHAASDAAPRPARRRARPLRGRAGRRALGRARLRGARRRRRSRARPAADEPGGVYLRLAHFGGMVFTHYFHLAAIPRGWCGALGQSRRRHRSGRRHRRQRAPGCIRALRALGAARPPTAGGLLGSEPAHDDWPLRVPRTAPSPAWSPPPTRWRSRAATAATSRPRCARSAGSRLPQKLSERAAGDELAHELRAGLRDEHRSGGRVCDDRAAPR